LKTEDIVDTTDVLQRGGKAPGLRINEKKLCTDRDPSTIR
jgi:hypothetical protein